MLNIYIFNLINFTKLCSLLATFVNTQETFQRCLNVAVRVIWHRDVGQCQINVEKTLRMSTLKRTTLSNVKSTFVYFNADINNVRQRRNNAVIFNVEFHNVDQRRNNVVYMTIFKRLKTAKKYFWALKKKITHFSQMWSVEKYENNSMSLLIAK